jgi:hypothetical protein
MKRRQFLKQTALFSASAALMPRLGYSQAKTPRPFELVNHMYLTDFCHEQDETPILFGNRQRSWLTTLRRLEYPEHREIISLFELEGGNWKEANPVTAEPGQFEAISADCAIDGEPLVTWTEMRNGQWLIQAALWGYGKFQSPVTLSDPRRRSINPVVKAIGSRSFIVVWEDYAGGKFSVWLSRSQEGRWCRPLEVAGGGASCFEPVLAVGGGGEIYLVYSCTDGPHRNIQMAILDPKSLKPAASIPIAVGGGLKDRVNINAKSSAAFDRKGQLWISWENNRFTSRLEDSDNYTGDRCCAMVCYRNGKLYEQKENGRWLFQGKNDHLPTFHKDRTGNLFVVTHCGGDFEKNPFWSFRVSCLDPAQGWTKPVTLLETKQKGESLRPTILFTEKSDTFWLAWKSEAWKPRCDCHPEVAPAEDGQIKARRGMLEMQQFAAPRLADAPRELNLAEAVVEEHHPVKDFRSCISGRPRVARPKSSHQGETYTLLVGNLHEHTEHSDCWPAGTDGTLHDDYRYGLFSEGYDFAAITDHDFQLNEVRWRKALRLADFYHDPEHFVALPSVEWTLSNGGAFEIKRGVGHRNIVFADTAGAKKFIRNSDEVYCINSPETRDAETLWAFIHKAGVDCVAIPHHPADEIHPCCWEVHDEAIEPVVELFQCRGNAEYRGAPRMNNLSRCKPTANDKGFVDYALREKKHRLGFVASGDHNGMGVGLACLWVKEVSRQGILEALRRRRCFATTGDKIVVDFRLNGAWAGEEAQSDGAPKMTFNIIGTDEINSIDILRNSRVIHSIKPSPGSTREMGEWVDADFKNETGVLYYYVRAVQKNNHIGWSSPIWVKA